MRPLDLTANLIVVASLSQAHCRCFSLSISPSPPQPYIFSLSLSLNLVLGLWNWDFRFVFFVSLGLYIGIFITIFVWKLKKMLEIGRKCILKSIFKNKNKHMKIFFKNIFGMQPNTKKYFPFPKTFSAEIILHSWKHFTLSQTRPKSNSNILMWKIDFLMKYHLIHCLLHKYV